MELYTWQWGQQQPNINNIGKWLEYLYYLRFLQKYSNLVSLYVKQEFESVIYAISNK